MKETEAPLVIENDPTLVARREMAMNIRKLMFAIPHRAEWTPAEVAAAIGEAIIMVADGVESGRFISRERPN